MAQSRAEGHSVLGLGNADDSQAVASLIAIAKVDEGVKTSSLL
jgi:hypothetical protein